MQVNPRQNMAIVPITKSRTDLARPHQSTAVVGQNDTELSKNSDNHEPRPLRRVIPFEKGHLVDIYV